MFGVPVVFILFVSATLLTLYRGAAYSFTTLYLPCILLLNCTKKINLPGLPDMTATYGVIYGIIGGIILKGGEKLPFKWGWMDTLMVLLTLSFVITGMTTEYVYTGVSIFGEQFLGFLAPYFLARIMFHSTEMRQRALIVCLISICIISFFCLIEVRLWPYWLSRELKTVGLFTAPNTEVLYRFGFSRAQTTFDHPIDMGNSCTLLLAMTAIFALTTHYGWKHIYVWPCLGLATCASLSSLSFTSWVGLFVLYGCFITLTILPFTRRVVILFVLMMFCGFAAMTHHLYNMDLEKRRDQPEEIGQTAQDSMFVRAMIIQNAMPFITTAGPFGYGDKIRHSQLALESVDNSYALFTMRRGWVFISLFFMIPVVLALRAMRAFKRAKRPEQWMPLAVGVSAILGIMSAMFTVWFGFAYAVLFMIVNGLTMSMCDVLMKQSVVQPVAQFAGQQRRYAGPAVAVARGA